MSVQSAPRWDGRPFRSGSRRRRPDYLPAAALARGRRQVPPTEQVLASRSTGITGGVALMTKIAVVYYSATGHLYKMADAVAKGGRRRSGGPPATGARVPRRG